MLTKLDIPDHETASVALARTAAQFESAITAGDPRAALAAFREGCGLMDAAIDAIEAAALRLRSEARPCT